MDILNKNKVSVDEMKIYFSTQSPFEPNNQRVGRFAKTIGFKLVKQMKQGKVTYFYIKNRENE